MSARKIDFTRSIQPLSHGRKRMSLAASAVKVRKSGVEFRAANPIPAWTEMSVDLQYPDSKKVHFTGVVVACAGNRQSGYLVSLLFTHVSRQSQARLGSLGIS